MCHNVLFCKGLHECLEETLMRAKLKLRLEFQSFSFQWFKKVPQIAIWFCMKFEDVLEVLPMLMPKKFVNEFIFIWKSKQCLKTFGQITLGSYYYIKNLKRVYYACRMLPYGMEDQTLLIDDEPNKTFWNPKWSDFF